MEMGGGIGMGKEASGEEGNCEMKDSFYWFSKGCDAFRRDWRPFR